jgi:glycosyltransferase involved in cell wall biosynthesis
MIKLSFVIPFYNGGKYIKESLDSLYQQNILDENFEVILVNDCSTDQQSLDVLYSYQKMHTNIKIIHNETNQRCGMCRNIGVQDAVGDYVWFVDQDDYIQPNCLAEILNRCEANNLDVLYFDYRNVSDDLLLNKKMNLVKNDSSVMTGLDYIHTNCAGDFWHSEYDTNVWHAVYKREFLLSNNVVSPPVSYCEDLIVAQHAIIVAQHFQAITNDYYCYRYNPSSVFNTQVGKKGRLIFDASIYAGSSLIKLSSLIDQESYGDEKRIVYEGGICRLNSFTKQIFKIPSKERKIFFDYVLANVALIDETSDNLSKVNRWILKYKNICQKLPHVVYLLIKILKIK